MKPLKGILCALVALFLCQVSYGQSSKGPKISISPAGDLVVVDSSGKTFTFKSITLQEEVTIDGVKYKISFGPGATSGDMVAIMQPSDAVKLSVKDSDFPAASVGISSQALAIFTFNAQNHTMVVESGNLGSVTVNNVALKQGERVAVNSDGTLVRNLGSGSPSSNPSTTVAQNAGTPNTPGQTADSKDQPVPEVTDITTGPGQANNMLASFSINLNPEASTPFLPGQ